MCYSAMVEQGLKKMGRRFGAKVDLSLYEKLFERRLNGEKISVAKALELNFANAVSDTGQKIESHINQFRSQQTSQLQTDLFTQMTRLNSARAALKSSPLKPTKKALNEEAVALRQIERIKKRLQNFQSENPTENDARIYAFEWAPVMIWHNGSRWLVPMRYHLRPPGMPEDFDRKYPGCYNARRDSLNGFWKNEFGRKHAVVILTSFFENVKLHDLEQRPLLGSEKEKNVVLKFQPDNADVMIVPCIWDHWQGKQGGFDSFALITDDPPEEVLATGHDRCPIFLNESRLDDWLQPAGKSEAELFQILDDRQRPIYKHAIAG